MPDNTGFETNSPEKEKAGIDSSYIDTIKKANGFDLEWRADKDLQKRQESILTELPPVDQLVQQLIEEIKKDQQDQIIYSKLKNKVVVQQDLEIHTRSLLFEKLVQIEKSLFFSKEEPIPPSLSSTTKWADPDKEMALTELIKHPPFKHLIRNRKTDLIGIQAREKDEIGKVEAGVLVITSTYEVKSGKTLDYRSYRQMKGGEVKSVEENMADFVTAVNRLSPEEAKKLGLEDMGKNGKRLLVVRKLRQHIVMTRNINIHDLDSLINQKSHQNETDSFSPSEVEEFKQMLLGEHPNIKVILRNSAISGKELDKLRDQVLPLVRSILEKK